MTMRRALSVPVLVTSLFLTACASAPAGPPPNATHPAWLTGTWQGDAWQIQASQTTGHVSLQVTFAPDGSWKTSTGSSGVSWLDGDRVIVQGVAADGDRIRYAFKQREGSGGHEIWGVVEANFGAAAVSFKRIR